MEGRIDALCADKKTNVPVVMTRDEVIAVTLLLDGTAQLAGKLLDGSGWRIKEASRLRGRDSEVQMKPLTIHSGKGDGGRFTTFPAIGLE